MARILVVDDDLNILEVLRARLESGGYMVETRCDPIEALDSLKENVFDLIVTDIRMPRVDGIEFLRRVRNLRCEMPVILLTAYGTIPNAVEAMKQGAYEYLTKPFQGKQLLQIVQRALEESGRVRREVEAGEGFYFPGVYGTSAKMRELYPILERIIASNSTVLIQGESGTGKELIAQMIHCNGSRKENRFVIMDCGSTPGSLIESELFGHARGAFTSATESRKGLFEVADKGTLFLDEIGSMLLELQTRLLRVLQESQIRRVGENIMREVDVRVIAATNKDLREQVRKGLFREDLYYRLAVLTVELPPLRERKEDIPALADYFLRSFSKRMKKERLVFGEGVVETLMRYEWPGNVRELKNSIEAAVVLARGNVLGIDDFVRARSPCVRTSAEPDLTETELVDVKEFSLPEYLERQERKLIIKALEDNDWVQKNAARQLGISPRVLCYKMKKMKIGLPAARHNEVT